MTRAAVPGSAKVHRNGEPKNKERSIDIKKIVKVETGTGMFPGSSGTKGMPPLQQHVQTVTPVLVLLVKTTVVKKGLVAVESLLLMFNYVKFT